jgi:predicted GIY-YIG superfamily endonuclease
MATGAGYSSCSDADWNGITGGVRERRSRYEVEESSAWSLGDARADTFYAYLLKLRDGTFYPGQTRDLQARLMEHKDGRVKMTAGCQPRLVWFTQLGSREEAALTEVELKMLVDQNPREVRKLIVNFRNLLSEVDTEA